MRPSSSLRLALASALSVNGVIGFQYPDCVNGPLANNTVCDAKASPPDRAAALVKALNIAEKLQNLVDMSKGAERLGLPAYAWWSEALHGVAASPGVRFNRTAGGRFSHATSFANSITLASAFDDDLVYKVADTISTEARAFANAGFAGLDYWTPNINPYKDPRWGRGHETPGEDPVRIKGYVKALLAGLEGDDPSIRKVVATCKHYAAYDLERWQGTTRHRFDAIVSLQDLSEYYLPPFQQCARDSKVGSFMCSYNALNGTPACASTYLMEDILRKHWGWTEHNNYITSDCNAIQDFLPGPKWHNFSSTQTEAEAAAVAYQAGTDTVCEVPGWPPYTDVIGAYNQTLLSEEVIDTALKRLYEGLVRVGYFDPASGPYRSIGWEDVNTAEAQELALQSAADGLVLLKNDGTLPLNLEDKTVALIGFWANSSNNLLGGYSGVPPYIHSPVDAADKLNLTYHYAPGPLAQNITQAVIDDWVGKALGAADESDVILYFGGTDTSLAAEDLDRNSIAWPEIQLSVIKELSALGKPLVITQLGDQVDDTPLLTNANVSAIIFAGYPGQSGGTAVLNAITGVSPPAGRLPVTQYQAAYAEQVPMTDMSLRPAVDSEGSGNPGRTYRWLPANQTVLPFGHGLHYTTFKARFGKLPTLNFTTTGLLKSCSGPSPPNPSNPPTGPPTPSEPPTPPTPSDHPTPPTPTASNPPGPKPPAPKPRAAAAPAPPAHKDLCPFPQPLSLQITNTGNATSDYVALVFARGEFGPLPYPQRTLVGYKRARAVAPGETVAVVVEVVLGDLARVDEKGNRVLYPGRYVLGVDVEGALEEEEEGREVVFEVGGEEVVLDEFPQPKERFGRG